MMNLSSPRLLIFLVLAGCLLPGCIRLGQRAPEKISYVLSAQQPTSAPMVKLSGVLQITPLRISPRFAGRSFVYRQGTSRYQADFYREFLVSPASLVQEAIERWLSAKGLFSEVSASSGPIPPDFILQGRIIDLYGDFHSQQPAGVLEIAFLLLDHHAAGNPIRLNRNYRSEVPLNSTSADALVDGWNTALAEILDNLARDIGDALITTPTPTPPGLAE